MGQTRDQSSGENQISAYLVQICRNDSTFNREVFNGGAQRFKNWKKTLHFVSLYFSKTASDCFVVGTIAIVMLFSIFSIPHSAYTTIFCNFTAGLLKVCRKNENFKFHSFSKLCQKNFCAPPSFKCISFKRTCSRLFNAAKTES